MSKKKTSVRQNIAGLSLKDKKGIHRTILQQILHLLKDPLHSMVLTQKMSTTYETLSEKYAKKTARRFARDARQFSVWALDGDAVEDERLKRPNQYNGKRHS